jgi:hypothetical protein
VLQFTRNLVSALTNENSRVCVVLFGGSASVLVPLTRLTDRATITQKLSQTWHSIEMDGSGTNVGSFDFFFP